MTKICFLDVDGVQKERDMTQAEMDQYAADVAAAQVAAVPQSVSRRQARQALLLAGQLDKVQPAIDGIADVTQRGLAQIYWDDSQDFERAHPMVTFMATAMGMTSAQLDSLFIQAATL